MYSKTLFVDSSWLEFFQQEYKEAYFTKLLEDIKKEYQTYLCYPQWEEIFQAFKITPLSKVKVIILGQDPYHQPNQAHGLAFSVKTNTPLPPSLKNIFQELKNDLNIEKDNDGNLTTWAKQGVLLLNTTLTVRQSQPNSHLQYQWVTFTDQVLSFLNLNCTNLVFILWGKNARNKKMLIDTEKHFIIESVHPSPLSAYNGFFNSRPFSKTNNWLISKNKTPIKW
ncbi:uracil-DNA glycosylase [Spiroplasma ixodetis]|uniref:uracil-DNA glycosylase n=1 Tax=Spiroplasma ixodetis TaxID=2141 RepID=UPI00257640C8|nr:uracil-DNA glycosylase [Spiroplasma ixodetis]WJG69231.1 uracil-DNA glycosylase [Spiroplasma ixodetis Y32]